MQISILTMNLGNTDVEGHRAGCADIAKKVAKRQCDTPWTEEFSSKREAFLAYNEDFIAEADGDESNGWTITWFPCCSELPDTTPETVTCNCVCESADDGLGHTCTGCPVHSPSLGHVKDETVKDTQPMTKTEAYNHVKQSREGLRHVDAMIYKGTEREVRMGLEQTILHANALLDALNFEGIKGL